MPAPSQGSSFPTFLQYWKNLINPKRRVVPILPRKQKNSGKKRSGAIVTQDIYEGTLSLSANGLYAVQDKDFSIDSETMVFGDLRVGHNAKVICALEGARRRAVKITLTA